MKLLNYLKSPKSDIPLFFILLILINLVSYNAFFRIDLTEPKSYTISKASEQVVSTLEKPLSIKVFFSDNLTAPYNEVQTYLSDLLVEYKGKSNENFSYEFFDMSKQENEVLARSYGLNQVQIQQIKNNEVGFKQVWMALAIDYADNTERIDSLTSADGLEYRLTTTISKMISNTSALSGLQGKVNLTYYASKRIADFGFPGYNQLEGKISAAYEEVNKKNGEKITFKIVDPSQEEIDGIVAKYGIQGFRVEDEKFALGLVVEYGEKFQIIPFQITPFGIAGTENLDQNIAMALQSVVSKSKTIGYIVGHNERDYISEGDESFVLKNMISDRYGFEVFDLRTEDLPSSLVSVVINGPKSKFSDYELYKLDQFLMRGGNIMIFTDGFEISAPKDRSNPLNQPEFNPIDTGLEKLLDKYGIKIGKDYVLDEKCYQSQNPYTPDGIQHVYYAPVLQKDELNGKNVISKNLGFVVFAQASSIDVSEAEKKSGEKVTVLAKSSPDSWLMDKNFTINPTFIVPPSDKSAMKSYNLAVLVEGKFESAFESKVENPEKSAGEDSEKSGEAKIAVEAENSHIAKSVQTGKIFVAGTSEITTENVNGKNGQAPTSYFIRNTIDYLNGEEDLCEMRTKGLSLNTLEIGSQQSANIAKYFNEIGIAILVALCGILVLLHQKSKKNSIRRKYNPDDSRENDNIGKTE